MFTRTLRGKLSEPGLFAYGALCAMSLRHLFCNEWDREYCLQHIEYFVQDFDLPPQDGARVRSRSAGKRMFSTGCLGVYDSRTRVLMAYVAMLLNINVRKLMWFEEKIALLIRQLLHLPNKDECGEKKQREKFKKIKRFAFIGAATVSAGAIVGLTGGMAAPLIASSLVGVLGMSGAAAVSSSAGILMMGSVFGAAGAGLTGYKMARRIGKMEEFRFERLSKGIHFHIAIAVTGWLADEDEDGFLKPWKSLFLSDEQYSLRYESRYLLELGKGISYLKELMFSLAAQEILRVTFLSGFIAAITWPTTLLSLASYIDNPWSVCCKRSVEVGLELADVLLRRSHGRRPVSLIGYSLGARVIFYCLKEMSRRKDCEGIVQDVVLLGAPVTGSTKEWRSLGRVVSGRLINGYSKNDWILKFLYRTSSAALKIAGLQEISWDDRRMINIDLSSIVGGHVEYSDKMESLLKWLGLNYYSTLQSPLTLGSVEYAFPRRRRLSKSEPALFRGRASERKPSKRRASSFS